MVEFSKDDELMSKAEELSRTVDVEDEEYEKRIFEKVEEINELIKLRKLAEPKGDNRKVLLAVKGADGNNSLVAFSKFDVARIWVENEAEYKEFKAALEAREAKAQMANLGILERKKGVPFFMQYKKKPTEA